MAVPRRLPLLLALAAALVWAAGCGAPSPAAAPKATSVHHRKGFLLLGLAPSPPTGSGTGTLFISRHARRFRTVVYAKGANSFRPGVTPGGRHAFVATESGKTYVLSLPSGKVSASFATPAGARLAKVAPNGKVVYVLGANFVAAYDTAAPYHQLGLLQQGGNTFAISPGGHRGYLAGNNRRDILELRLPALAVVSRTTVGRIGDLALSPDGNHLWAADMFNGDMFVLDTASLQVAHTIKTPEGDPNISFTNMMAATAGFMQLSMGPKGGHLYAAGFSGHVLVFNTNTYTYGSLTIQPPSAPAGATSGKGGSGSMGSNTMGSSSMTKPSSTSGAMAVSGPPKLSGLVVLPGGREMVATAENYHATLLLSTATGKTMATFPKVAANRWVTAR
ncbi:MAG: hypothetical protein M0031_14525 [Thermaerobacter sp.]|jgi:YVTN family beta-propeller protein|nr:hypothetical protein [Thermaerobacter sp.]